MTEPVGDLACVIAGAEKNTAGCARRSPGNALEDAGSIPDTSTSVQWRP